MDEAEGLKEAAFLASYQVSRPVQASHFEAALTTSRAAQLACGGLQKTWWTADKTSLGHLEARHPYLEKRQQGRCHELSSDYESYCFGITRHQSDVGAEQPPCLLPKSAEDGQADRILALQLQTLSCCMAMPICGGKSSVPGAGRGSTATSSSFKCQDGHKHLLPPFTSNLR